MVTREKLKYASRRARIKARQVGRKARSLHSRSKLSRGEKAFVGGYGAGIGAVTTKGALNVSRALRVSGAVVSRAGPYAAGGIAGSLGAAGAYLGMKGAKYLKASKTRGYKRDKARIDAQARREVQSAKMSYVFTSARKAALRKAQKASARLRRALGG